MYRCTILIVCVSLVCIEIKRSSIFVLVENLFNINVIFQFNCFSYLKIVLFSDKIMFRLIAHPPLHSHQHHDRRLIHKPRHRYQYPLMFHMDMDARHHQRHKNGMLIIKTKINIISFTKAELYPNIQCTQIFMMKC